MRSLYHFDGGNMLTDIEIALSAELKNIKEMYEIILHDINAPGYGGRHTNR